jgi:hypothetical protein
MKVYSANYVLQLSTTPIYKKYSRMNLDYYSNMKSEMLLDYS